MNFRCGPLRTSSPPSSTQQLPSWNANGSTPAAVVKRGAQVHANVHAHQLMSD